MARKTARFRISIKDNLLGDALKIELVEHTGASFTVRQNGRLARRTPHANLTLVTTRLRRWLVKQVKAAYRKPLGP